MTTRELIALLQSKDPSGNMRVFIAEDGTMKELVQILSEPQIVEIDEETLRGSPHNFLLSEENIGEKVLVL